MRIFWDITKNYNAFMNNANAIRIDFTKISNYDSNIKQIPIKTVGNKRSCNE